MSLQKPKDLFHQKKAFEILSILIREKRFITAQEILDIYEKSFGSEEIMDIKTIPRAIKTLHSILGKEVISAKRNKGYFLNQKGLDDEIWICTIIARYISLTEVEAMNFIFEPLVHVQREKSLYNLAICQKAKETNQILEFDYTKYLEDISTKRQIQVYGMMQRDTKFQIIGKDLNDGRIKHFFLIGISNPKIQFQSQLPIVPNDIIKDYHRHSLGNHKSDKVYDVEIYFTPESSSFLEKELFQWNRELRKLENGYLLKIKTYSKLEVFNLVSNFMDYAELISPSEWREEYKSKMQKQLEKYSQNPPKTK